MSAHLPRLLVGLAIALCLGGCGEVKVEPDATTGVTPDGSGPAPDGGAPEADADPDAPVCGNGRAEQGEQCDDGNDDDSDGCTGGCLEVRTIGCADGRRDGYLDLSAYPDIASCAGAWTVAGLAQPRTRCAGGGDDDPSQGQGCAAADLCAGGWHLCAGAAEVADRSGEAGCSGAVDGTEELFFATQQGSSGSALCDGAGENDLFGCGSIGASPSAGCAPLDHFSGDVCSALPAPWQCTDDHFHELATVTKATPASGGVLCCRD